MPNSSDLDFIEKVLQVLLGPLTLLVGIAVLMYFMIREGLVTKAKTDEEKKER